MSIAPRAFGHGEVSGNQDEESSFSEEKEAKRLLKYYETIRPN
ncbi:hypothetical protein NO263_07955 [Gluconacetobacter entanii]|uniref:Uncharacterized protein n=1 Tax=Gluconacetobacter entanii TaxID=108528 RepID=A0ABT3K5R7_9PROT|nr:hypothetical protein [Gluconacetobacter entanii]MCW4590511.1 hypothetical protein [Gluconacetobacter entanii]MCW4594028.1 hypothetical protein [Gluconacetobacter entanii]